MSNINDMIVSDYHDKGTEFSASDFTNPLYKLWVSKNFEKNKDEKQSFKAWNGQLIHKASYDFPEIDVIKEFSFVLTHDLDTQVGGSVDRCTFLNGKWQIEDIKTMGNFPAKKAFKEVKQEWIIQLSIYKLGMESRGLSVSNFGVIHQYVMGYQKDSKLPDYKEYNRIIIALLSKEETLELIEQGVQVARNSIAPVVDCPKYLCKDYCSFNKSCPAYKGGN